MDEDTWIDLTGDACHVCDATTGLSAANLIPCACKVVRYCSRACQQEDKPEHDGACKSVKKARKRLDRQENRIHNNWQELFPENPLTGHRTDWWDHDMRPYTRALVKFIEAVSKIRTIQAVEVALERALQIIDHNPSDNMGIRGRIPALMIRLDKGHEAYGFIKQFAPVDIFNLQHSPIPDEGDVFEDVPSQLRTRSATAMMNISHRISLTLLKIRLVIDLILLQAALYGDEGTLAERIDNVCHANLSKAMLRNQAVIHFVRAGVDPQPLMDRMISQVKLLLRLVETLNPHFWRLLANATAEEVNEELDDDYGPGSDDHAHLLLQENYEAWTESPMAMAWLRARLAQGL